MSSLHQSDDDNFDDDLVINDDDYNDTGYNQSESDSEGMVAEVSAFDILLKYAMIRLFLQKQLI